MFILHTPWAHKLTCTFSLHSCLVTDILFMFIYAEKLLYFSEKFDAKLFISRIHQETNAADLEAGALALKSDLIGRTQQRKQLVKDNFDCFVSCKTTIDGKKASHLPSVSGVS